MESFVKVLTVASQQFDLSNVKNDDLITGIEKNLDKYIEKAKDTLKKKHIINPKPQKRFARIVEDNSESDGEEKEKDGFRVPAPPISKPPPPAVIIEDVVRFSGDSSLRPVRSAKVNASKNLKELPMNAKMRNDNNMSVVVKSERTSGVNHKEGGSRDSLKENSNPKASLRKDEDAIRRSASVELIEKQNVEIDITHDESDRVIVEPPIMPPPPPPVVNAKQKRAGRPKKIEEPVETTQMPRITRSKIKKEKPSLDKAQSAQSAQQLNVVELAKENDMTVRKSVSDSSALIQSKVNSTTTSNNETTSTSKGTTHKEKKEKKKYPMPILVKIERTSDEKESAKENSVPKEKPPMPAAVPISANNSPHINNETYDFPVNDQTVTLAANVIACNNNQTITLAPAAGNVNETVTIEKNPHDSLMTEDNDDDEEEDEKSMVVPLTELQAAKKELPQLKLKKNEVFNPFMPSPVKQRVQAFEKHAVMTMTPEKGKFQNGTATSATKYNVLKAGTPSKIATYTTKGVTPMSNAKKNYMAAVSSASSVSASSSSSSAVKKSTTKKFTSMSNENQEELKKIQTQAQLEERRRQREEKQKQVQLQREAIEKQKREQTLQQQREREEKFRRNLQEKEEQKRLEAMKKKAMKENQERKYAEERARLMESSVYNAKPAEPPHSATKDDSLHIKMQKQIMMEKSHSLQKKADKNQKDKNPYSFDMLNTDDSTDDEGTISKKRPDPPFWSKKQNRKKLIILQSSVNPNLLDTLFSVQPINVDLRAIFPSIDSRKLQRNSSAVWNTPPRYSVYAKNLKS